MAADLPENDKWWRLEPTPARVYANREHASMPTLSLTRCVCITFSTLLELTVTPVAVKFEREKKKRRSGSSALRCFSLFTITLKHVRLFRRFHGQHLTAATALLFQGNFVLHLIYYYYLASKYNSRPKFTHYAEWPISNNIFTMEYNNYGF